MFRDYEELGIEKRLIELRERKGLTQKDVADKLNISAEDYVKIEEGEEELMTSHLYTLCDLYGCRSDYIIFGV